MTGFYILFGILFTVIGGLDFGQGVSGPAGRGRGRRGPASRQR